MYCEKCGAKMVEGATFCGSCGARAESPPAREAVAATQVQPQAYVSPVPPVQAPIPPSQSRPYVSPVQTQSPAAAAGQQFGAEPLGVGQYIGMLLLMAVPLVNFVFLFIWGFGGRGNTNPNKRNFARATLIVSAIGVVFLILARGLIGKILGGMY